MTRAFRGIGRNVDRRVSLLRKATTCASSRYGSGGIEKRRQRPAPVTLPSLDTARSITKERP